MAQRDAMTKKLFTIFETHAKGDYKPEKYFPSLPGWN